MDYYGLLSNFKINRRLSEDEIRHHLSQSKVSSSEPYNQVSVIKINSTYLECVDKFFCWKGLITAISIYGISIFGYIIVVISYMDFAKWPAASPVERSDILFFTPLSVLVLVLPVIACTYLLHKESFRLTHYPMRFNRKTRMVHVFRLDGTVMSEPWDKLYFTLGKGKDKNWDIRGHKLADDGETVLETFALAHHTWLKDPLLFSQWEFIRLYMEEGPKELIAQVEHVMDVAEKRETFWNGFHRLMAEFASAPLLAYLMSPFLFIVAVGRWIAMHTSKIPVWPAEIEAQCQIEPNDPYRRDAQHRPTWPR